MMAATVTHFVVAAGLIPASGWPTPLATLALKQKLAEDQARLWAWEIEYESAREDRPGEPAESYLHRVVAAKAPDRFFHWSGHGTPWLDWHDDPYQQRLTVTAERMVADLTGDDIARWRCPERDGVNCLYLQLCLLGYKGTYEEVVSAVPGSAEQASLGGLAQAARRLGFALVSAKMTVAELSNLRSPVVVLLEDAELGHGRFHLLLGFSASKVHLVDGGFNTRFGMMPIDRFRHGWTGFALVPRSASFWPGRAFGTALGAVTVGVAVWFARRAGRERQRRASTPPGGMTPFSPEAV